MTELRATEGTLAKILDAIPGNPVPSGETALLTTDAAQVLIAHPGGGRVLRTLKLDTFDDDSGNAVLWSVDGGVTWNRHPGGIIDDYEIAATGDILVKNASAGLAAEVYGSAS